MRCRNRIRPFLARTVTQVDRIFITTALTIAEDKAVGANPLFLNKEVDNGIYPVPAKLLSGFA